MKDRDSDWTDGRGQVKGPIPEGMTTTVAARVVWLNRRHHAIQREVLRRAEESEADQGYRRPEWQLLEIAQQTRDARR